MTNFAFKLELPDSRPFYSAALVAQLTTHALWPEGDSVEAIIGRIDPMAYDDYPEAELPADFLDHIKKMIDEPEVSLPSTPKLAKVKRVAVWNRFSAAPDHYKELCAMYRKEEIAFLDPVSYLPVDPKIPDMELQSANVPLAGLVKFANSLSIDVLFNTSLTKKADSDSVKPLSTKERTTLLKLVGGLARIGAELDIHSPRINGIKETVGDLALNGVVVDEDTLRKYLKAAAELMSKPNSV